MLSRTYKWVVEPVEVREGLRFGLGQDEALDESPEIDGNMCCAYSKPGQTKSIRRIR